MKELMMLLNARSLNNKIDLLHMYVAHYKPCFVAITESWANSLISDSIFAPSGYQTFRKDRTNKKGGGVMLFVSNCLKCELLDLPSYNLESVCCKIVLEEKETLLIVVIYRPPDCDKTIDEQINAMLKYACQINTTYKIVVGDFNLPAIDWVQLTFPPANDEFMNTIFELNLIQHVLRPTRDNVILDLIFTDSAESVLNIDIIEPLGASDHNMVLCELNVMSKKVTMATEKIEAVCFDYDRADWLYFQELL